MLYKKYSKIKGLFEYVEGLCLDYIGINPAPRHPPNIYKSTVKASIELEYKLTSNSHSDLLMREAEVRMSESRIADNVVFKGSNRPTSNG